ncbi:MAG: hypothetical protein ABJG47_15425 [Ekhidna sp.]
MRVVGFTLIFIFFGCSSTSTDRIVVPELHAGFYSDALERINEELVSNPQDERLVDQKLFYCEQLDWPTTCITALDAFKEKNGMTSQLVEQYIAYYKQHERFQLLLDVIDKWSLEYQLEEKFTETYIDCLTRLGRKASATIELNRYLKNNQSINAISFASKQYLSIGDSTLAAYNLGKLHKLDPENALMWDYGQLLISIGYHELGFEVMRDYVNRNEEKFDLQLSYAKHLANFNLNQEARTVLKRFSTKDTVSYMLADLYKKDQMWDSASFLLEVLIAKDSSVREPIWRLAQLYDERGWFLTAIPYLEYLTDLNPPDTIAQQKIDLIQRKIAYLQRLKFEENKIPIIELQPKKIEN